MALFELHTLAAAGPAQSCCRQPAHLSSVPVLSSPLSKLLLLSRVLLLRHAGCLDPCFIVTRLRLGFLQGFPTSQRGQGIRIERDFPVMWGKKEEVSGPSPEDRSLCIPAFRGGQLVWLWFSSYCMFLWGRQLTDGQAKWTKTFELLCLPLQAVIFHDSAAHIHLHSTPVFWY